MVKILKRNKIQSENFSPTIYTVTNNHESLWTIIYSWLARIALISFVVSSLGAFFIPDLLYKENWIFYISLIPVALFVAAFVFGYAIAIILFIIDLLKNIKKRFSK